MKLRYILTTMILLAAINYASGQIVFKEGYLINNKQERTECLIRNVGQEESTSSFQYKLKDDKTIYDIELSKIEEFGVEGEMKCIRALIAVDVSPSRIKSLSDTLSQWEEGHAFLKVLVEGELATLYTWYDQGMTLFFYRYPESAIEPLVYKKYALEITPNIVSQYFYNNTYKEQLRKNLSCGKPGESLKVSYTQKDLVDYFVRYHACKNADCKVFKSSQVKKGSLRFKAGVNSNTMQFNIEEFSDALPNALFSKENTIGYGAELEYLLPFNLYKWGVFAEMNLYSYVTDRLLNADVTSNEDCRVDYSTTEFPVGITHYMNINKDHRLFVRSAFVPHIIMKDSYIQFSKTYRSGFSTSSRALFGAGYNYKRLSFEFRYYTNQNITMNIFKRSSELTQLSFRLSYNLFETKR